MKNPTEAELDLWSGWGSPHKIKWVFNVRRDQLEAYQELRQRPTAELVALMDTKTPGMYEMIRLALDHFLERVNYVPNQ